MLVFRCRSPTESSDKVACRCQLWTRKEPPSFSLLPSYVCGCLYLNKILYCQLLKKGWIAVDPCFHPSWTCFSHQLLVCKIVPFAIAFPPHTFDSFNLASIYLYSFWVVIVRLTPAIVEFFLVCVIMSSVWTSRGVRHSREACPNAWQFICQVCTRVYRCLLLHGTGTAPRCASGHFIGKVRAVSASCQRKRVLWL